MNLLTISKRYEQLVHILGVGSVLALQRHKLPVCRIELCLFHNQLFKGRGRGGQVFVGVKLLRETVQEAAKTLATKTGIFAITMAARMQRWRVQRGRVSDGGSRVYR